MRLYLYLTLVIIATLSACQTNKVKPPTDAIANLEAFEQKEKFDADTALLYPGIADTAHKAQFTKLINLAADDFKVLIESGHNTECAYHNAMNDGLKRFKPYYINTEDRERICQYYEEMMDIVGLDNNGGILTNWIYGEEMN
mgnify:FL=1